MLADSQDKHSDTGMKKKQSCSMPASLSDDACNSPLGMKCMFN